MSMPGNNKRAAAIGSLGFALAACASTPDEEAEPQWAAVGWLNPGESGDPEVIGTYLTRAECEAAVADWMARQVVGNPVSGDCLPISRE
jgi:hypothetical protein